MDEIINKILRKKFPNVKIDRNLEKNKLEYSINTCKENIDKIINEYSYIVKQKKEFICTDCNEVHVFEGNHLWFSLALIESTYLITYSFEYTNIIINKKSKELDVKIDLPKSINIIENNSFHLFRKLKDFDQGNCIIEQLDWFLLIINNLQFIKLLKPLKIEHLSSDEFERDLYTSLINIKSLSYKFPQTNILAEKCNSLTLISLHSIYSQISKSIVKEIEMGNNSLLNLHELILLSKRDEYVLEKYGLKEVDTIFEEKLNLLVQSFGFYVIQEQKGIRMIDLICISKNAKENYTFLIEAKSTKSQYNLPAQHSRAIKEYVLNLKKHYTSIPKIEFCLIVSHSANISIEYKLKELSDEINLPVKFCSANILALIKEKLMGAIDLDYFKKIILSSGYIVEEKHVLKLIQTHNDELNALKNLLKTYQKKI